jgi:hypothetical protein
VDKDWGRLVKQTTWYLNRGPEIAHRVGEQFKRKASHLRRYGWESFERDELPLPQLPIDLDQAQASPELLDEWRKVYHTARARQFDLLGVTWPKGLGADLWHIDPVSGSLWPAEVYCFNVSYRNGGPLGDVKYVWELNRLQFLHPIAALSALTHDPEPAKFCLEVLEEWCAANPPFLGVNWTSGIELGLRSLSILTVLGLIDHALISAPQRRRLSACLKAHAFWLDRYPSKFSSANNHLIAEAGALLALGLCWPELPQSKSLAAYGREVLTGEAEKQILADGVGAEQSPTYTSFTLEWLLLCLWLTKRAGEPLAPVVLERVKKAGEHLRWFGRSRSSPNLRVFGGGQCGSSNI